MVRKRQEEPAEAELAAEVQARREALLGLLPGAARRTTRRVGSAEADTFEDKARVLAADLRRRDQGADAEALERALEAFQAAVNALWTHAIRAGLPGALAAEWRRTQRRRAQEVPREDLEAEVVFLLRRFVVRFAPREGERLFSYARRGVLQALTEWSTSAAGPVHVPQRAARGVRGGQLRAPLRDDEASHNPWPEVDEALDRERES